MQSLCSFSHFEMVNQLVNLEMFIMLSQNVFNILCMNG